MRPVIIIPGMWGGTRNGDPIKRMLQDYHGAVEIVNKEACDRSSIQAYLDSIKAQFAHFVDPILVAHSFAGLLAVKLLEQKFSRTALLTCPVIPTNISSPLSEAAKLRYQKIFDTNGPYQRPKDETRSMYYYDVPNDDFEEVYRYFYPEELKIYEEMATSAPVTQILNKQMIRENAAGEIFTSVEDPVCVYEAALRMADELGFGLHAVRGGHVPFLNHNKDEYAKWLLSALERHNR